MLDFNPLALASELRARAREISDRAGTFHEADTRQMMRSIAATYEKLAQRLEQYGRDADKA